MTDKYLYCIEHEVVGLVQSSMCGDILHEMFIPYSDGGYDIDWCFFDKGWATCPPPDEFEEDWDLHLDEPSDEELQMMDESAEELLMEFC